MRAARRRCLVRGVALSIASAAGTPLGGCGFVLRGSGADLAEPGRVFVDADRDSTIARALIEALSERSFPIAVNRDEADVLLRLADERVDQRIVSVQSAGRVSELELTHSVDFLLAESVAGEAPVYDPVATGNSVRVAREFTYDETQVLGKANEEATLRAELRAELVRQIVLRTIASLS